MDEEYDEWEDSDGDTEESDDSEESPGKKKGRQLQTHLVTTGHVFSRYIFRSDIAYDWSVTEQDITEATMKYKDNQLRNFARKYARLREPFTFFPMDSPKSTSAERLKNAEVSKQFRTRANYTPGFHVQTTYTTFAHFWLIKSLVRTKEWRLVTDQDSSLLSALRRAFAREIRIADAHHFICLTDRKKGMREAYKQYERSRRVLNKWAIENGYDPAGGSTTEIATAMLTEEIRRHGLYQYKVQNRHRYPVKWTTHGMEHPLPGKDEGRRQILCGTDLSAYEPEEIASMLMVVSDKVTSAFFNQVRRRLSVFERPIVTARGKGRTYMYSSNSPKYAQQVVTIFRCYYNFMKAYGGKKRTRKTPAQRLGIADRAFTWQDIVYFR